MCKVNVYIDKSKSFRVYATDTTELVLEAAKMHDATPLATAALGRVLTGTGLMSVMLKNESDKLTVIFKGEGPAKQIIATGKGTGDIKGYIANPHVDMPLKKNGKLDVGGAIGLGTLTVIKDLGFKEPYTGKIDLVSGEIAEDLTAYYYISEQQNTSIGLGVKVSQKEIVKAAGGVFIQMLPGAEEGAIEALEDLLSKMRPVTTYVEESEDLQDMTDKIFGELPDAYKLSLLEEKMIRLKCDCSRERMTEALMTIGEEELRKLAEEDKGAEIGCHFCGSKYQFSEEELRNLISQL